VGDLTLLLLAGTAFVLATILLLLVWRILQLLVWRIKRL
jgi:hypothetical protein